MANQIDSTLENIVILADALTKTVAAEDTVGTPTGNRDIVTKMFAASCQNVYDCCTKFTVAFNPPSTPENCVPFAEKLEQACHILVKTSQGVLIEIRAGTVVT